MRLLHLLARPLAPDELEDKLQRWEVGRTARTWIGLDKIEKLIGLTRADFAHYRSTVVGRTVAESGFDFEEVRRKVVRVFIFDRSAVMTKTAEADIIPIRTWKEFEELYVSKYNTDPTVFDDCVFQQRQLKSNRGTYSLAHEVFGITQSRIALKSRIESLQRMGVLPEVTQPIAPPAASNMSPQLQRHEQRCAKRAADDQEKEKYAGVPAAARSLVDSVDILTDSPCVMMMMVEEPLPAGRGPVGANSFSALCLFMRSILKAGSWQIGALYMCAVWAMNEEVVFAVRVSVECGRFYEEELNWLRKKSSRLYLAHYPAGDFKMRELPGHLHAVQSKFYKKLVAEPTVALPGLPGLLARLSGDNSRQMMLARIAAGAAAGQKTFAEHASWIYKAQGLPLHINTPGSAGSAARAIVQVAGDLCFGVGADAHKAAAMTAVVEHQDDPEDVLFLRLMKDDVIGVRHFLRQYHLVLGPETECIALAAEWRDLARHVGRNYFNDPDIHDSFDKKFPVLHQRQQHWVDPYLTDTLHNEAEFSIQRRLHDKSLTPTSMDDRMWWDIEVLAPLREKGRQVGEKERAASKVARDGALVGPANKPVSIAASDWSRTYAQCNAVCVAIVADLYPKLTDAAMDSTPRVRKDLKVAAGLVKQDRALAQTWLDELKENAGGYRRAVSLEELQTEAAKVHLAFKLKPLTTEKIPLRHRLELPFSSVPAPSLDAEIRGALPLGLLALKVASRGYFACAAVNPPMRLLLAVLLPSRPSMAAVVKAVAASNDNTIIGTAASVFDLVRAERPMASVSDAQFIVRFLGLTPAPIVADLDWVAFGALLAQVGEDKLVGLSALLMRRRQVAEATTTVPYFRASGVLLKGNALTALTAFSESALRVLEYLGGYSDDRRDNETGELLAGSPEWGPEAGSAGAMFILGCMAMGPAQRREVGCTVIGGKVSPLPYHGTGGFVSVLLQQEQGAAEAALVD